MAINSRLKDIQVLDSFLMEKTKVLSNILSTLGWSENSLLDENKVQCPKDPGHWIPESSLAHHLEMCMWMKEGYLKEDKDKQPPSSKFFYRKAPSVNSLIIDKETQANTLIEKGLMEIKPLDECPNIPQTIDRWTVELTPEQRLAVYDYIVKEGKLGNRHRNVTVEDLMFDFEKKDDQDDKPKTQLELIAEYRDYKRRRQSYRAKNVHITKKSYTEVMKEVIENQITYLAETRKQETAEKEEDSISQASMSNKEGNLDEENSSHEEEKQESYRHCSHKKRSRSPSSKRRKHKKERSRSRSKSRRHKKSHHKHKKSHS